MRNERNFFSHFKYSLLCASYFHRFMLSSTSPSCAECRKRRVHSLFFICFPFRRCKQCLESVKILFVRARDVVPIPPMSLPLLFFLLTLHSTLVKSSFESRIPEIVPWFTAYVVTSVSWHTTIVGAREARWSSVEVLEVAQNENESKNRENKIKVTKNLLRRNESGRNFSWENCAINYA